MAEAGILTKDDRVELIDGEIVDMAPIGRRHAACVCRLARILEERLPRDIIVRVQQPVHLGDHSEPEPDLALVPYRADFYSTAHPTPNEALLLVEVGDASLSFDERIKSHIYAQAGIAELWVVDLVGQKVLIYLDPDPTGYRRLRDAAGITQISLASFQS